MNPADSPSSPTASLEQLLGVLSGHAEDLIYYYDCLINAIDQVPWGHGPDDLFIEPEVLTARAATPSPGSERKGSKLARWLSPRYADWSPLEAIMGKRDERERDPIRRVTRGWDEEFRPRPGLRRVVLGAPGGGKTYATKATVVQIAREAQKLLRAGIELPETVVVPIWISAAAMTGCGPAPPGEWLLRCLEANPYWAWGMTPLAGEFRRWLEQRLASNAGFIVIDALDEAGDIGRRAVTTWLGAVRGEPVPVVLTCRTMDWRNGDNRTVDWARRDERKVIELARFDRQRQEEFLNRSLPDGKALPVLERLRKCDGLEHLCGSPLLLAFAGWLGGNGKLTGDVTAFSLFSQMIYEILRGEWRGGAAAVPDGGMNPGPDETVFLQRLCWRIFLLDAEQSGNQFTDTAWHRAWKWVADTHPAGGGASAGALWDKLHQLGLVQSDKREATPERGEPVWHFAHYILFEFLAACGWYASGEDYQRLLGHNEVVIRRVEGSGEISETARCNPFWLRARFQQVLLFVAGRLPEASDVRRLLAAVARERDDIFHQMLDWRLRILSAATCRDADEGLADCAGRAVDDWWRAWHAGARHNRAWLAEPLRDLTGRLRQRLLRRIREGLVPTTRRHPLLAKASLRLGFPANAALYALDLRFQADLPEDLVVRLGDGRIVAEMEDLLRAEGSTWGWASGGVGGRLKVIQALAGFGAESSARLLVEKFRQPDLPDLLRANIASALGEFRHAWIGGTLIDLLKSKDLPPFIRRALVQSLGRVGDPAAAAFLRECLREQPLDAVRIAIGDALARLRDGGGGRLGAAPVPVEFDEALLERLVTGEVWERRDVARQFERREDPTLGPAMVEAFLTEGNAEVRDALAHAIEQCVDPGQCDGLIARLQERPPEPLDRGGGEETVRISDWLPPVSRQFFEAWTHGLDVRHMTLRLARIKGDAGWLEEQYRRTVQSSTSPDDFFKHLRQAQDTGRGYAWGYIQVQLEAAMNALTRAGCVKVWAATARDGDRTDQLLEWLRQEREPFVRREIVAALGDCGNGRALIAVRGLQIRLGEWSNLTMFIDGLGKYQDPERLGFSVAPLIAQRSDAVLGGLWKLATTLGVRVPAFGRMHLMRRDTRTK